MQLSRDAIQRMIGGANGAVTGSGGSGGGVSTQWVGQNYVAIDYWNTIFTVHGTQTVTVTDGTSGDVTTTTTDVTLDPNTLPSTTTTTDEETGDVTVTTITITEVEVNHDFYSNGAISALGAADPGSGGGGTTLGDLLSAMNSLDVPTNDGTYVLNVSGSTLTLVSETTGGGGSSISTVSVATPGFITGGSVSGTTLTLNTRTLQASDIPDLSGSYLPLSGGTMTGQIVGTQSGMWYQGRDYALVKQTSGTGAGWGPVLSVKTANGSWELGAISSQANKLLLTYTSDDNYNSSTNSVTTIYFPTDGGTLALTSDIPTSMAWSSITGKPTTISGYGITDAKISSGVITLGSSTITPVTTATPTSASTGYVVTHGTISGNTLTLHRSTLMALLADAGYTWWGESMSSGVVKGGIRNATYIEFNEVGSSAGHGGYIDFHYNGSTSDYTSRIIEQGESGLLNINAALWAQYNGNVGIGNSSPSYKLDVNGSIRTTGDIYMTGSVSSIMMGGTTATALSYNSSNSSLILGYGTGSVKPVNTYIDGQNITLRLSSSQAFGSTGTATYDETKYGFYGQNFIGVNSQFLFYYDSGNNTVWVSKPNGDAVNFASKGGVSALGLTGGSSSATVSSLSVGTLTLQNSTYDEYISIDSNNDMHFYTDARNAVFSGRVYADFYGGLNTSGGNISLGGGKIFLDSTRYLFVDSSDSNELKFFNGTEFKTLAT